MNNETQGQLRLFKDIRQPPEELGTRMIAEMQGITGWVTRAWFRARGWTEREIRIGRQYSHAAIIFGQAGYRLRECATVDEINACINTLESRARVMQAEAVELRKKTHGGIT
ncbi:MAG: hypothetical protein AAB403_07725 [Planctomycetota bacterium]